MVARAVLERRLLDVFLERVRQQPFADEGEREERLRSVQNRVVDLLDSWRKVFEDYRQAGVAMQYQKYELEQPRASACARCSKRTSNPSTTESFGRTVRCATSSRK